MSAARFFAAAAAVAASALFGHIRAERELASFRLTERLSEDLLEAERILRLERAPLEAIAARLKESGREGLLTAALSGEPLPASAPQESASVLFELMRGLGTGDPQTEAARLISARERLLPALEKARSGLENSARLKRTLPLMFGLASAMLIL